MDKKQYNNVIDWTLKHEQSAQTEDSLATARAIFNNMGVALPSGDIKEVCEILKTDDYMGWRSCTAQEAQQAADNGDAAIAISEGRIVVLSATDEEEPVAQTASVMLLTEKANAVNTLNGMSYYSYSYGGTTTATYPYVDIPQTGNIGTFISYMGYHLITNQTSNQYKLKAHAQNAGKYSYSYPEYYAQINDRILIATKPNIGNQLPVSIGDRVQVKFLTETGEIRNYLCMIGDIKGADAPNIWGHNDGKCVVEVIYHNYNPLSGYNKNKNNPWGPGRVIRITKTGRYGDYL